MTVFDYGTKIVVIDPEDQWEDVRKRIEELRKNVKRTRRTNKTSVDRTIRVLRKRLDK